MDVLAVERCEEGSIDTIDAVVGQVVGLVFQSFDRRDLGIKMGRILKHLLQNGRRGGQPFRQLGEHVVELFVSGKNPQSTVSMKVQNTRDSFKLASARNLARLGLSSYKSAGNAWYRAPNHQASVLEELHEQDSRQKPTDMSPDCDATRQVGTIRQVRKRCDELPEEPPDENHPGGNRDPLEEADVEEEHPDADSRIKHRVSAP